MRKPFLITVAALFPVVLLAIVAGVFFFVGPGSDICESAPRRVAKDKPEPRISGRVIYPDGSPAKSATVRAFNVTRYVEGPTVVTAADGGFSVDVEPDSFYYLLVRAADAVDVIEPVFTPASNVVLVAGGDSSISGRVIEKESGGPVTEYTLIYRRIGNDYGIPFYSFGIPGRRGTDDDIFYKRLGSRPELKVKSADGKFELAGLPPGSYVLDVIAEEHVCIGWDHVGTLRLVPGECMDVTVPLWRAVPETTILRDGKTGEPITWAVVTPISYVGWLYPHTDRKVTTDEHGSFTFTYTGCITHFRVVHRDFGEAYIEAYSECEEHDISWPKCAVTGTIYDIYGKPAPYGELAVKRSSAPDRGRHVIVTADRNGNYSIDNLESGYYWITRYYGGLPAAMPCQDWFDNYQVHFKPGEKKVHDVGKWGDVVTGIVYLNGEPAQDVYLKISPCASGFEPFRSWIGGRYAIEGLEPGEYRVWVAGENKKPVFKITIPEKEGDEVRVFKRNIRLKGSRVSGRVADAETGLPVRVPPNYAVDFRWHGAAFLTAVADKRKRPSRRVARIGPSGAFSFDSVAPGEYMLEFNIFGYGADPQRVTVAEKEDLSVKPAVSLLPSLLSGTLVDNATGKPLVGGLQICSTDHRGSFFFGTDKDGFFSVNATPGEYTVEAHWPNYEEYESEPIIVVERLGASIDIRLVPK